MFKPKPQAVIPPQDYRADVQGVSMIFNHTLKLAIIYDMDSSMPDNRYDELARHLEKQGWMIQVIVAAVGIPIVNTADRE